MKNIKFFLKCVFVVALLLVSRISYADGDINLTLKNNGAVILSTTVALPSAGSASINDSDNNPHSVDARSVLNIISLTDTASADFSISNLIYYSSFNAFYLKCINASGTDLCDNWQYKVNGTDPGMGMDQDILSGGENVVLFFGNDTPPPLPADPIPEKKTEPSGVSGSYIHLPTPPVAPPVVLTPPPAVVILPPVVGLTPKEITQPDSVAVTVPITENIPKVITKKIVPKPAPIKTLATNSVATAVAADTTKVETTPVPKANWLITILKWLFGF